MKFIIIEEIINNLSLFTTKNKIDESDLKLLPQGVIDKIDLRNKS